MSELSSSQRVRDHLRRNVYGLVALFVALSGTAAALPGQNDVRSDDIKRGNVKRTDLAAASVNARKLAAGSVTSAKIAPGAVTGAAVGDDSLTGADVDEATLSSVLRCPAGTSRAADVCYTPDRPAADGPSALNDCADELLRLPTISELGLIAQVEDLSVEHWSETRFFDGDFNRRIAVNEVGGPLNLTLSAALDSSSRAYYCATSPDA